jgi:ankyrin repeat protein
VVNWRKAPAYNRSRLFTKKINQLTPLPHAFNIRNTQDLIQNLKDTPMLPHYTLASLDITNLYSNIPVIGTKTILNYMLIREHTEPQTQSEILSWYDVITKQNYFTHNNNIVIQRDGLAMGALIIRPNCRNLSTTPTSYTLDTQTPHNKLWSMTYS